MFKKVIVSSLILLAGTLNAVVYCPQGITIANVKEATNNQVAWDIHGVIGEKMRSEIAGPVIQNIFGIIWTKVTGDDAWAEIAKLSKENDPSGEANYVIFLKHGHTDLARMVEKAANAYKPRVGMEQIVREIHAKHIPQRIASNIGPKFFINLDTKFKKEYGCFIFDLITMGKIVDYSIYGKNPLKNRPAHLTPYGKPNPKFYADYNATYPLIPGSYIIFIDDKLDNVIAATRAGWVGIHFDTKKKNPVAQLRKDLRSLGII